jgi:hypothetical protein
MYIPDGKLWSRETDGKLCKFLRFSNTEFLCTLQCLSSLQHTELDQLISEFPEVFSDKVGSTNLVQCKLEVEGPPIAQRRYPVSAQKRAIIKKRISEML